MIFLTLTRFRDDLKWCDRPGAPVGIDYRKIRLLAPTLVSALMMWAVSSKAQAQIRGSVYASGFTAPVAFVQDPIAAAVHYVVEQGGRIRVVQNGAVLATDFLDLGNVISSGGERGLLGLAFAPDYATSG